MIEESAWGQRSDGKVPTTILPVIERQDDIDINCYFILRALRYIRFHQDHEFGRQIFPALLNAVDWLASRDVDNDGLPEAGSYWYDWKDVSGFLDEVKKNFKEYSIDKCYIPQIDSPADIEDMIENLEKTFADHKVIMLEDPMFAGSDTYGYMLFKR